MTDRQARRVTAGAVLMLLVTLLATSGRYGFHRDELYFVEAGQHPAFGYPDLPPLVPLLASAWHAAVAGWLPAFRLVPALAAAGTVLVGAATCRALGGDRADSAWAAVAVALASGVSAVGHLFSTTTFDLLATSVMVLLLIRALDQPAGGEPGRVARWRPWLALGLVAGLGLELKTLPATVLLACAAGLVLAGPRAPLRTPGPWLAAAVALVVAAPNLGWQAANGWPQLALARAIAAGSSGTSADRWAVLPLQLSLTGPVCAVAAGAGLVALLRSPRIRRWRWLGAGYLVLLAVVVATGGKPYYTLGLVPALLAAGAPVVRGWVSTPRRRRWLVPLLVAQLVGTALATLPVLPLRVFAESPLRKIDYDTGETVGWPQLVNAVAQVAGAAASGGSAGTTIVLTQNYGEAGALSRASRQGVALPPVYSGHDGYGWWGPPPAGATRVIVVGPWDPAVLGRLFDGCAMVARIDNGVGLDNDEQGAPIRRCTRAAGPWTGAWPLVRHLD